MANPNPSPATRFKPGQVANPNGRPVGSRNRLSEAFLGALADNFEQHGAEAIEKVRQTDPVAYLRIIAGLVPKDFDLTVRGGGLIEALAELDAEYGNEAPVH